MITIPLYAYAYFVLYAFLGWVCEDVYCGLLNRRFINRGFLFGPYCPIYGVGALLVLYPLLEFVQHPAWVFILGVLITSCLEYVTSWLMEMLFHTRWWDYSNHFMNIHGRVCLLNSTLFGILCLVVVYGIHPIVKQVIVSIPFSVLSSLLGVFTILFLIDIVHTVFVLIQRNKVIEKMRNDLEDVRLQVDAFCMDRRQDFMDGLHIWLEEHSDVDDRIERIQEIVEHLQKVKQSHVAKAFPQRSLKQQIKQLETLANELNAKRKR